MAPIRILLVSSTGGVLLDLLALEAWWSRHHVQWVAVDGPDTREHLAGARVDWQPEQAARRPVSLLLASLRAVRRVRRERPDLVVSAGTGVAVPWFLAARACRVPTFWVETFNIVDRPGLAARLCARLADRVLVQRPELVAARPRAVLVGELY
jgi:hypothetical protein